MGGRYARQPALPSLPLGFRLSHSAGPGPRPRPSPRQSGAPAVLPFPRPSSVAAAPWRPTPPRQSRQPRLVPGGPGRPEGPVGGSPRLFGLFMWGGAAPPQTRPPSAGPCPGYAPRQPAPYCGEGKGKRRAGGTWGASPLKPPGGPNRGGPRPSAMPVFGPAAGVHEAVFGINIVSLWSGRRSGHLQAHLAA